jgi:hypothetical protein
LSFLFIYTFTCLDPTMLIIVPIAIILYFVMFSSFLTRHPPPPHVPLDSLYPLSGPPLAPPTKVKPVPELSKDFFYNMRDLQNSMEDFSVGYDWVVGHILPVTNFVDEEISSMLFIAMFGGCIALFLIAHLIPWRFMMLCSGWGMTLSSHPKFKALISQVMELPKEEKVEAEEAKYIAAAKTFAKQDIVVEETPERREVEIFELQHRPVERSPASSSAALDAFAYFHNPHHSSQRNTAQSSNTLNASASSAYLSTSFPPATPSAEEWLPALFSAQPYTPSSPVRISGQRPRGVPQFEEVKPPPGWRWVGKKWSLDLLASEWVRERCVVGVEVEVEGGRWVVDVRPQTEENLDWGGGGSGRQKWRWGEWRRRRWVRVVERVAVGMKATED